MEKSPDSPYYGKPVAEWGRITRKLVDKHPLKPHTILELAFTAWDHLWRTTVGAGDTAVPLGGLDVPAIVIGYFFEVLFARDLAKRFPGEWRGNRTKEEKDLVCERHPKFSIEIKTSGQPGYKVYGNRSQGQQAQDPRLVKKERTGYHITVNYFEKALTLVRFGWIDAGDWAPQEAGSGQMSGLPASVYQHQLIPIRGAYELQAPVALLPGVGPGRATQLAGLGVRTIRAFLQYEGVLPARFPKAIQEKARAAYGQLLT
jgi:hypothetical protein